MHKNHNKIKGLKEKVTAFIVLFLDVVLDATIPYSFLSKTRVRDWHMPVSIRFSYVINQKFQRMQLLHRLRLMGVDRPFRLKAWWSRGLNNFGDELLGYLLARIAGVECVFDPDKHMMAIGSIIRFARDNTYVWGSGIIRQDEIMSAKPICLSVRGPLTRAKMVEQDIQCPEIYGDPAMLFPLCFKVEAQSGSLDCKKTLVVPHFKHNNLISRLPEYDYQSLIVRSIDDIEHIVTRIAAAPCVITSSLHGFIFCVAYGVPVSVFKLESKGIGGDNIKFDDFCLGVGIEPVQINEVQTLGAAELDRLSGQAKVYAHTWDPMPLLESLYKICPTDTLKTFTERISHSHSR